MQYTEYTTAQNDVLDAICHKHYGKESGTTELVLRENPGLVDHGTHLPMGLTIKLPIIDTSPVIVEETVQLWT